MRWGAECFAIDFTWPNSLEPVWWTTRCSYLIRMDESSITWIESLLAWIRVLHDLRSLNENEECFSLKSSRAFSSEPANVRGRHWDAAHDRRAVPVWLAELGRSRVRFPSSIREGYLHSTIKFWLEFISTVNCGISQFSELQQCGGYLEDLQNSSRIFS